MVSFLLKSIKEQRYGTVCLHGQLPNLLPPPSDGHCKISVTAAARNVVSAEARRRRRQTRLFIGYVYYADFGYKMPYGVYMAALDLTETE